jgi:hypothetical protein
MKQNSSGANTTPSRGKLEDKRKRARGIGQKAKRTYFRIMEKIDEL